MYICGVHGIKIQNDAGKVFIKSIYAKIVPNWDKHDPDIHTCGTWIKWKLEDKKLYQPIEKISIDPKSQATDKTGPQYVEHGRKREQNPNELTVVVRKNKCVRGLSYSPRKSLNIKKKIELHQEKWHHLVHQLVEENEQEIQPKRKEQIHLNFIGN